LSPSSKTLRTLKLLSLLYRLPSTAERKNFKSYPERKLLISLKSYLKKTTSSLQGLKSCMISSYRSLPQPNSFNEKTSSSQEGTNSFKPLSLTNHLVRT
jgi:hypothetical protein